MNIQHKRLVISLDETWEEVGGLFRPTSWHTVCVCVCVCVCVSVYRFIYPGGDVNLNTHRLMGTRVTVRT